MPTPALPLKGTLVDPSVFHEVAGRIWVPNLDELFAATLNQALGGGKGSLMAQEMIYNRLFGRPTEKVQQESRQAISITIRPIVGDGEPEGEVTEGEFLVLPAVEAPKDQDGDETVTEVLPALRSVLDQVQSQLAEGSLIEAPTPALPPTPESPAPKKRGRPKKNPTATSLNLEDIL